MVKSASGYLVRTPTPWLDSLSLGSALSVADVPLTVALHGIAAVAIPVVSTYDQLTGRPYPRNQEPPVRQSSQAAQSLESAINPREKER